MADPYDPQELYNTLGPVPPRFNVHDASKYLQRFEPDDADFEDFERMGDAYDTLPLGVDMNPFEVVRAVVEAEKHAMRSNQARRDAGEDVINWAMLEDRDLVPDGDDNSAAPLTYAPTSTTNPNRPRTLAAGYDVNRQVLTIMFRDGTLYNYHGVTQDEWDGFKGTFSKGPYISAVLDAKVRMDADSNTHPGVIRQLQKIYTVAQRARRGWQPAGLPLPITKSRVTPKSALGKPPARKKK